MPQPLSGGLPQFRLDPPFTLGMGDFGCVTFLLHPVVSFQKLSQPPDSGLPVTYLRPTLGSLGDEAGGEVPHSYPGISGISVLTSWSRTTEKFEFQF